ncbi:MAG: S4 domain-containing protein [Candidatus Zixiibacteriota bacterium]
MRIDDFLSTVGLIKRRTEAKDLGDAGMIEVNGRRVKPSYIVKVRDIIRLKGAHPFAVEVLDVPTRSVSKDIRERYFRSVTAPGA